MAYNSGLPATGGSLVAADIRENFRALKEDGIVLAGDLVSTLKDPATSTAGLRTLGTGAQQAMPGNATPTPADNSVTEAKLANGAVSQAKLKYAPGSVLLISSDAEVGDNLQGTWIKRKEIMVARTGTLRVSYAFQANYDCYANIHLNGTAVGTQRTGNNYLNTYTEDIGDLVPGSLIQIYTYSANGYGVLVKNFRLYTDSYQSEVVII